MADKRITSRTKVYITRIGVRDWLVAVDSQKAALKAWDVHRNLFAEGAARVTNDPAHVALAMRTPGVPVAAPGRVSAGETASNVVDLASRRKDGGKGRDVRPNVVALAPRRAKAKAPISAARPKADRAKLDAAEQELRAFEREAARRRAEIERRKRAVETELEAFDAETERRRARLGKRVARERAAFESQG